MHQKLLARVGEDHPSDSMVIIWIRKLKRGEDIHSNPSRSRRLPDDRLPVLIAAALEESPFHSVRSLTSAVKYPPMTVRRYLCSSGYVLHRLHIVLHTLSPDQKLLESRSQLI
jgi:hypothetical protein